jgi:hypothetical protein
MQSGRETKVVTNNYKAIGKPITAITKALFVLCKSEDIFCVSLPNGEYSITSTKPLEVALLLRRARKEGRRFYSLKNYFLWCKRFNLP